MALAARLNLRMQKELKLLLTDPPPGASFPQSDLSSSFSLSTIHAQIEGPEGTVYEKGRFKIKIQIPERYPFQPPIVTFSTPIYHPNIDTGGRICLDILNLPPKGAWQPSLNISTVLTSIGLLLSEPNPDDGLMCEASREYKYNRQTFDQKARSMTEKYAKSGASENESDLQSHSNSIMMEAKGSDLAKSDINEYSMRCSKLSGISRKLSLETSGSNTTDTDKGVNEVPSHYLDNQLQVQGELPESKDTSNEYSQNDKNFLGKGKKLALRFLGPNHARARDEKENVGPHHGTTPLNPQSIRIGSSESLPVLQPSKHHEQPHQLLHQDHDLKSRISSSTKLCHFGQKRANENFNSSERTDDCEKNLDAMPQESTYEPNFNVSKAMMCGTTAIEAQKDSADRNCFTVPKRKKLGLAGKKPSVGFLGLAQSIEKDYKGNMAPNRSAFLSNASSLSTTSSMSSKTLLVGQNSGKSDGHVTPKKLPRKPLDQLEGTNGCNVQLPKQPENVNTTPSESVAVVQESGYGMKQQQQDHGERFGGGVEQCGEELCMSEEVIVLDSEDSEEEREGTSSRSKLSIARKSVLGKWKAKS